MKKVVFVVELKDVRDIMTKDVKWVAPDTPVIEALEKMVVEGIASLIVREKEEMVGIITSRDILSTLLKDISGLKVQEIMTRDIITVDADTDILKAAKIMGENKIDHLPVMEEDKLVGIVSTHDITHNIVMELRGEIPPIFPKPIE